MPLDPAGNPIRIGWSETEEIWLRAASTLTLRDREAAFRDIASLTGRTVDRLRHKAALLKAQDRQTAKALLQVQLRKNWLSETTLTASRQVYVVGPNRNRQRYLPAR